MPRVFFAIELPGNVREQLAELQKGFPGKTNDIKWVERKNLHITLHFIGDVDELKLRQLLQGAEVAAACSPKFKTQIKNAGVFPSISQPHVLWAGIGQGREQIAHLAHSLSIALGDMPKKPFVPHLTLGRVRKGKTAALAQFMKEGANFSTDLFTIDHFFCYESVLTKRGPVYKKIKEILL